MLWKRRTNVRARGRFARERKPLRQSVGKVPLASQILSFGRKRIPVSLIVIRYLAGLSTARLFVREAVRQRSDRQLACLPTGATFDPGSFRGVRSHELAP